MAVEKLSMSFEPELSEAIRTAAASDDQTVSSWIADAARQRLRNEALQQVVGEMITEAGFTDDDLQRATERLDAGAFWTEPDRATSKAKRSRGRSRRLA